MGKKYLITPEQEKLYYDFLFLEKYRDENGMYPTFRGLQQETESNGDSRKVKYYVPEHPKANITLKTYVELYLKKNFNFLKNFLSSSREEIIPKTVGRKSYLSKDGKTMLRSEFEALAHNIFVLNNISHEIEVDSDKFRAKCEKIPDFVWEKEKIIIEIAGMEKEKYWSKLRESEKCLSELGYKVIIIDTRPFEKRAKYKEFYKHFCDLLGLEIDDEVLQNPYPFLSWLNISNEKMQQMIDDNVCKIPKSSNLNRILNQYIRRIHGIGLKEYQKKIDCPRYRTSISKNKIIQFKIDNPLLSNAEIAKHFKINKNTVQRITSKM
jgi:hypothetical protein